MIDFARRLTRQRVPHFRLAEVSAALIKNVGNGAYTMCFRLALSNLLCCLRTTA